MLTVFSLCFALSLVSHNVNMAKVYTYVELIHTLVWAACIVYISQLPERRLIDYN